MTAVLADRDPYKEEVKKIPRVAEVSESVRFHAREHLEDLRAAPL